jgi:hypothetical protein
MAADTGLRLRPVAYERTARPEGNAIIVISSYTFTPITLITNKNLYYYPILI